MDAVTSHFVVESLAAVEDVRKAHPHARIAWHTTSPMVIKRLGDEGLDVRSLEEGYPAGEFDSVATSAYAATEAACAVLNERCAWRDFVDMRAFLGQSLNATLFAVLHKGRLLDRLLAGGGGSVTCVGDPSRTPLNGLSIGLGRFDTLYAVLAARCADGGLGVRDFSIPEEDLVRMDRQVRESRMGRWEKSLSILNNTAGSFAVKVFRNLRSRGLYPFRHVTLNPFARTTVYLGNQCELLDESFTGMLRKGVRVGWLPRMPKVSFAESPAPLPEEDALAQALRAAMAAELSEGWQRGDVFDACLKFVLERALVVLRRLHAHLPELRGGFEAVLGGLAAPRIIAGGIMTSPLERLFRCLCRERGEHVVTFEHGVTQGLSRWTDVSGAFYAMQAGDSGVYHTPRSAETMRDYASGQRQFIAGLPKVMGQPRMTSLQRRLARRWLGIGGREHVVMYVADLDRNNQIYGPYAENDLQFLRKTESIVARLAQDYPSSTIVLKLYPTQRYVDMCDFGWLEERHPRVRIIRDMDFRFIRFAADVLVTTSSQSTLGWVCGAGKQVVYFDFPWAAGTFGGLRAGAGEGLLGAQLVVPDTSEFLVPYDDAFISRLVCCRGSRNA